MTTMNRRSANIVLVDIEKAFGNRDMDEKICIKLPVEEYLDQTIFRFGMIIYGQKKSQKLNQES